MICARCGEWMDHPSVESRGPSPAFAACPRCGYRNPFDRHPLWFIAGSSGTGKTALAPLLRPELPDCVVFEAEAIDYWRFRDEHGYAPLYDQWLKVAREIALNRVPVVMLGIAMPDQLDASPLRAYFSTISFLGLICDEGVQAARLWERPLWRNAAAPEFIRGACAFTSALKEQAARSAPPMPLVDTGAAPLDETVAQIVAWVRNSLRERSTDAPRRTSHLGPRKPAELR